VVQELGDYGMLTNALVTSNSTLPITISGTTVPDIEYCVREAPPYLYILASKREGTNVVVTFSGLPTSAHSGDVLYEYPRTVSAQNGQFSDTFAPLDVHVYRFNLTTPNPTITSQPQSRTNSAGTTATFNVAATGLGPLTYQWRMNGSNLSDGGNVSGATNATLTLTNVQASDAGTYLVVISNAGGLTVSSNATLTVPAPISITAQPASLTNYAGTMASFSVTVIGSNPQFQWRRGGTNLVNGGNVSGATAATLTLSSILMMDAGTYAVSVTNDFSSVLSSNATLVVLDPGNLPVITNQPASRTNNAGTSAVFSVGAQGPALSYQWLRAGASLPNGGNVSGATTMTLTLASVLSADATSYSVIVSNASGSVTSAPAGLTVLYPMPWYEPFGHPAGSNLGGQMNGNFLTWSDVGTGIAGPYVTNVAGNLTVVGLPASSGNSIRFGGLGKSARFSFAPGMAVTSGTLFYSFILKVLDTTGLSSSGIFFAGFNNTMGTQTSQPSVVATRLYIRSAGSGFNLGVAKNSSTATDWVWDSRVFTNSQVIFVVGSYTFNSGSASDDVSTLWLNPSTLSFGSGNAPAASATATTGPDIGSGLLASFVFFQRETTEPGAMIADELRIGPTWASVTPPPPPIVTTLTSPKLLGNGAFQFAYTNSSGINGSVYASTTLTNWAAIGAATQISSGLYQFTDTTATNYPRRFYQLRSP
jgi:hypothetical protein